MTIMSELKSKVKLIFFGTYLPTPEPLQLLFDAGYDIVAVITNPDRDRATAPSPVKELAQKLGLLVLQPGKLKGNEVLLQQLIDLTPEVGAVFAYGKIIPQEVMDVFPRGILNIHPSLLPKYRGPSPLQTALLNGDKTTGVTIMLIDKEMDHGPMLSQKEIVISPEDNMQTLGIRATKLGGELLVRTLAEYIAGKVTAKEQDHSLATFTRLITTVDAEIKLDDSVEIAIRKIKAFNPDPGSFVKLKSKNEKVKNKEIRLKIFEAEKTEKFEEKTPLLKLRDGYLLLKKVQPQGKRPMSGEEFLRGHKNLLCVVDNF